MGIIKSKKTKTKTIYSSESIPKNDSHHSRPHQLFKILPSRKPNYGSRPPSEGDVDIHHKSPFNNLLSSSPRKNIAPSLLRGLIIPSQYGQYENCLDINTKYFRTAANYSMDGIYFRERRSRVYVDGKFTNIMLTMCISCDSKQLEIELLSSNDMIIVIYDVTKRQQFNEAKNICRDLQYAGFQSHPILLVGEIHRVDTFQRLRSVSRSEAMEFVSSFQSQLNFIHYTELNWNRPSEVDHLHQHMVRVLTSIMNTKYVQQKNQKIRNNDHLKVFNSSSLSSSSSSSSSSFGTFETSPQHLNDEKEQKSNDRESPFPLFHSKKRISFPNKVDLVDSNRKRKSSTTPWCHDGCGFSDINRSEMGEYNDDYDNGNDFIMTSQNNPIEYVENSESESEYEEEEIDDDKVMKQFRNELVHCKKLFDL